MLKDILLLLLNKKWAVRLGLDEYNRNCFPEIFEIMIQKGIKHSRIVSKDDEFYLESHDGYEPVRIARFSSYGNYMLTVAYLKNNFKMDLVDYTPQDGQAKYEHDGFQYNLTGKTENGAPGRKESFHIIIDGSESIA